jgi:DNA-binding XRE family transcriptional regulator
LSLDISVLIVIAASFALGQAMATSGLAGSTVNALLGMGVEQPWVALGLIYVLTVFMTELLSNNAAAVLMFPVAVSLSALFAEWRKNPAYLQAMQQIDAEFSTAAAMIDARTRSSLTQAELAKRIGTTQSSIARMESGRYKLPQTTLEKYAAATGTRLRIFFEPT